MAHTIVLQTTLTAFSITHWFRHSEQKRTCEQSHVTNDVIAHSLTKLFGINDFPAAKDSGKVLIIIIYCYLIIIIIIFFFIKARIRSFYELNGAVNHMGEHSDTCKSLIQRLVAHNLL